LIDKTHYNRERILDEGENSDESHKEEEEDNDDLTKIQRREWCRSIRS
jgi:hypothetical protein